MLRKIALGLIVFVIACGAFAVLGILVPAGTFKTIKPHFNGSTAVVPTKIAGPEDIEIDRKGGLVFISTDDRRSNLKNPGSVKGSILFYKIEKGIESMRDITPESLTDFHPHGISLYRSNDTTLFLFAINHQRSGRQVVERFEWKNDSLIHLESIGDTDLMTSPNDLVAVGERKFYVTNDHYYMDGMARVLEEYLQRAVSFVNYYDGKSFRTVANEIGYANGINQSNDGQLIFVAACTGRSIFVFKREENGDLTRIETMALNTGPDNIDIDEEGNLLVACHPQLLKFVAHAKDKKNYSPSQVLKISYRGYNDFKIDELFLNDGSTYSGSSVAVTYGNKLLIGSVFEPSILLCTLN